MNHILLTIATGFYVGFLPFFPGTWGSAFALLPYYFARPLSLPSYILTVIILLVVGFFSAGAAEKILNRADAGPEASIVKLLGVLHDQDVVVGGAVTVLPWTNTGRPSSST